MGSWFFGSPERTLYKTSWSRSQSERPRYIIDAAAIYYISLALIITSLIAVTKYLMRSNLMGDWFVLAHSLRVLVHSGREGMLAEKWSGWSHWVHSKEPESVKEVESGYKTSRPIHSDSLLPVRLHNLPKYSHQLGPKRDILNSNHNKGHKIFTAIADIYGKVETVLVCLPGKF